MRARRIMTMNNFDDLAWKREFDRVEAKQKKAQPTERTWADEMVDMLFDNNHNEVKDSDNEINW